ncbi:hypothetical protein EV668_1175 [Enterovirga rhinocerotis]|uniref:Uncharacterized protein n=1 Tax=Enterovirga rhinocerotis TaxID=1339210 RepID=A0A4R7CAA4_9HYPH|nr:hypothetical protein EV668_1175 [Enterovirga rhinocerotis]
MALPLATDPTLLHDDLGRTVPPYALPQRPVPGTDSWAG